MARTRVSRGKSTATFERQMERALERQLAGFERRMQSTLGDLLRQSLTQMLSSGGGGQGGLAPLLGAMIGLPHMARGGVVDGAQLLAVGGEAGPEAVMPLERGADGTLGVRVTGGENNGAGGSGSGAGLAPIIINIHSADADGTQQTIGLDDLGEGARDNLAVSLSRAVEDAVDQAVASRLREQMRDGGLFSSG